MSDTRQYLAKIGRRGGIKSRRVLEPDVARRMVEIREARRAARRTLQAAPTARPAGTPADTSAGAQAVQDVLWRRTGPPERLAMVAQLSRMVDALATEGLKQRHPSADVASIRYLRAELRLGRELAAAVYGAPIDSE